MHTFKKEERLCSIKLLDKLFHSGSSFLLYPFRLTWLSVEEQGVPVQVVIQVSKRRYKRAVDRNLIKRRIRELYRIHKSSQLYSFVQPQRPICLGISYVGKDIVSSKDLEPKLLSALKTLVKEYQKAEGGAL
ncbi:MAG: ribonuclease P protein component [Sphingobacteriaceae bacterium]